MAGKALKANCRAKRSPKKNRLGKMSGNDSVRLNKQRRKRKLLLTIRFPKQSVSDDDEDDETEIEAPNDDEKSETDDIDE